MKDFSKEFIIADIIALSIVGELNEKEQALLDDFLNQSQENRDLYNKLKSGPLLLESVCSNRALHEELSQEAIKKVHQRIKTNKAKLIVNRNKTFIFRKWKIVATAACVIAASMIPTYLLFNKEDVVNQQEIAQVVDSKSIDSKVKLILADGKEIMLDEESPQDIDMEGGTISLDGKKLTLKGEQDSEKIVNKEIEPVMHTVITERGGEVEFTLDDGSRVWLNADSRLEFPVQFTGKERRVVLIGEAYFEVSSNKDKPFIVQSQGMNTRVLGTTFNIKAYNDDPIIQTTLISGKVEVDISNKSIRLNKGFAAVMNRQTGKVEVVKADIESIIAWKSGYYIFNDKGLDDVMRTLARWYDIEHNISSEQLVEHTFSGRISKYETLEETLERITFAGGPQFKVEGRVVYIE